MKVQTECGVIELTPAEVLAVLYNNTQSCGMGFLDPNAGRCPVMTVRQAGELLATVPPARWWFDYLWGRPLKIDLRAAVLDTRLYNRDARIPAEVALLDYVTATRPEEGSSHA